MAKINIKSIANKVSKSPKVINKMEQIVNIRVENAKRMMVEDFDNHPVSMEIKAGPNAGNSSGTLGGYGNLYTFIGFRSSARPIEAIASLIQRQTYLIRRGSKPQVKGRNLVRNYSINYMNEKEISSISAAQKPWESGSWIDGIEKGLSSFGYYMYKNFEEGRSGKGLQAKKGGKAGGSPQKVRTSSFSPMAYVTQIVNNFRRNIRTIK
mgnify:CR=1 FL=1